MGGDENSCAVKLANMMNKDSKGKMKSPKSMDDLFEMFGNQELCEKTLEEGLMLVQRAGRKAFFKNKWKTVKNTVGNIGNKAIKVAVHPSSFKYVLVHEFHENYMRDALRRNPG